MTESTSQAVRDAWLGLRKHRATDDELLFDTWGGFFEHAVRADEAAGLVDILARLVRWSEESTNGRCVGCWHERGDDHLPDCPWVEGMNAVAEAQR